jgi:UDP-N-acetylglucosamine--N-acetylmuramyl-(pentapeptide) pyrophosphoryl-undecaprenol N-acetylglucosamine transferase
MKILLVGGGSGGPVSPLLAVAEKIKTQQPDAEFLFVGGHEGPERGMAEAAGLKFAAISAGRLRRYFSLKNFIDPFLAVAGMFQAKKIIQQFKPNVVFGAGSFVQVPVMWAAYWAKVLIIIHQQDVLPSLANKLCLPIAAKITVTFEASLKDFPAAKTTHTGNPFRQELAAANKDEAKQFFRLTDELPVLLVTTGGTGAAALNDMVIKSLPYLTKIVQVIHQTGAGKGAALGHFENYHAYEFIPNMGQAYAVADLVLCRAGVSTITELSNLGKMAIIVPIPGSHQEYNSRLLEDRAAAFVIDQKDLDYQTLPHLIRKLLFKYQTQQGVIRQMQNIMPHDSAQKIAEIIIKLCP